MNRNSTAVCLLWPPALCSNKRVLGGVCPLVPGPLSRSRLALLKLCELQNVHGASRQVHLSAQTVLHFVTKQVLGFDGCKDSTKSRTVCGMSRCEQGTGNVFRATWLRIRYPSVCLHGIRDTWEFPKIRGTVFWGPYNKDPTM